MLADRLRLLRLSPRSPVYARACVYGTFRIKTRKAHNEPIIGHWTVRPPISETIYAAVKET